MKRLLVLSDPPAAPGYLPRMRFLCDYFVQNGWDVTLLTEQYQELAFGHSYPITAIPMYSGGSLDWACKTVWTLVTDWHNRAFAKRALGELQDKTFDIVLCTAFSDFPLGAAKLLAEYYHIPLVCDIRDLDEQVDNSRYQYHHRSRWLMLFRRIYRAIHIRRRNKVLRAADVVTTISPWHTEFIRAFNPNVYTVYNGYDSMQFYAENMPTEVFKISYIGSLFEWQKPGLAKIKKVIEDLRLPIVLEIHTPDKHPVAHTALGDAIRQSAIMLVLTSPDTHGMLTTKFYEALGCEKPVLCVPSDNGTLAELIQHTHAGIATDDIEAIRTFILDKYHEWQDKGFTRQTVQDKETFSRQYQAQQMKQILLSL